MASTMNILGTYSGITMDTIEQLVQAEANKVVKYTNEQEEIKQEQTVWKDIQTRLDNLASKLSDLMKPESFESKKVTASPEGKVVFTAGTKAISGDYSITVSKLATRTQVTGNKLNLSETKITEAWGKNGTLKLTSQKSDQSDEAKSIEIEITAEDSLEKVMNKINDKTKDSGISAVMIDNRIVLQEQAFGDRTISIEGDIAKDLGLENSETRKGQAANLTVNGIPITRDSNQITDVMDGVTLDLKAVTSEPIQVSVEDDLQKASDTVKAFVDQYNSTLKFIEEKLDVGDPSKEDNKTGALSGDSSLMRLQSQLRSLLTQAVDNGNKGMNTAEAVGITVDRYGAATLDEGKLKEALKENPQKVMDLFSFTKTTEVTEDGTTVTKKEEVGLAQKFNTLLNSFTDSKEGVIATKNETYDKLIKDLNKRIETFNERLEVKRKGYIEQFTALDIAMMEAESQLSYLMSQVGTTNGNK
ncbi:flagellar filament capping protein FliD [Jeotgalibaca caeni]|uniref:flagellar filament capping protein FliD n=1 Tax=Jeotgalibaca caeni TaxID=3028623 RepID=UPI00237D52DB|nr:flagellar filament capping protein FliD [Jeotgalibaca caeni]MDE1548291.1 flagellar filament capping protein FliD [Jeotgalibaca caeni]